jgi:hypothetical protein
MTPEIGQIHQRLRDAYQASLSETRQLAMA